MLSGAGLVKEGEQGVHVHATTRATMEIKNGNGEIELIDALRAFGPVTGEDRVMVDAGSDAPIYIIKTEDDGSITGEIVTSVSDITFAYSQDGKSAKLTIPAPLLNNTGDTLTQGMNVMVDYYVIKKAVNVSEIQITAADFAGYYYVEADTLFRTQATGIDMPANLTFPNVKVQSGFTISMSGTGDPSTFDFTMDAFPGYTYFDKTKEVLCVIQIVEDSEAAAKTGHTVMPKNTTVEHKDPLKYDSDIGQPTSI